MFTGIVQELGEIRERIPAGKAVRFLFSAPLISNNLRIGDSVSCDGACLTVERCDPSGFSVSAVPETLAKTTMGSWQPGNRVNLEPALTPDSAMGGHFVLGHVDGICEVVRVEAFSSGEGREITVRLPEEFLPYCVYKGSLTLSGVSLTIASMQGDSLRFALIPQTVESTNLNKAKPGTLLNFEVDILAKYVERQLAFHMPVGAFRPSTTLRDHETPLPMPGIGETDLERWGYGIS